MIGIDPGLSGALAVVTDRDGPSMNRPYIASIDMPTLSVKGKRVLSPRVLIDFFEQYPDEDVCIEDVHAMPGQGVSSMFRFGESFGIVQGIAFSLNRRVLFISPQRWKKFFLLPPGKDASVQKAMNLFPELRFARKKDHGQADAILLAYYGLLLKRRGDSC